MQVFKFGGASVATYQGIENVARLIAQSSHPLVVIVSAMGKTTNALEKVAEAFFAGNRAEALTLFATVKQAHDNTAKYLLVKEALACEEQLRNFYTEVEWLLHDKPVRNYDYYYDQIVCVGELLSTTLVAAYLREMGVKAQWADVRDMLRTDDNYRDARVDWAYSAPRIQALAATQAPDGVLVTQGFIGATADNESTTLGREGSDYTAAIFSNVLEADNLSIWKDVAGVMSADPKKYPEAALLPSLSFAEVIEMAYYGAQVIHPKTIKPLQNKNIPLLVKCFLDASLPGTKIEAKGERQLPPMIIHKSNQLLVKLTTRDFSFINETTISHLYRLLDKAGVQPSLIQSGAISISLCLDNREEKIASFCSAAENHFDVQVQPGLELLTVRHYQPDVVAKYTAGKEPVLVQQSPTTFQQLSMAATTN